MIGPRSESDADHAAMERLQAGDDLALNDLMSRWTPRVSAFLIRFLGSMEDARDLTQETFVAVYSSRFRYRPSTKFSSWLFGIASNLAKQRIRWRVRHPEVALELVQNEPNQSTDHHLDDQSPSISMEAEERRDAVRRAIAALPSAMRELVILSEYEDLPHSEIAQIAGCSLKAVETRLYRARKLLAEKLSPYLGS